MRDSITFYRNGNPITVRPDSPTQTLLDYLRLTEGRTGTKEGCCEGDCGACTIVIRDNVNQKTSNNKIDNDKLNYMPINSCIYLLGMLDGKEIITIEDIAPDTDTLHPIQKAMVDAHGSQCGFCTPGFIMSLYAFYQSNETATIETINDALSGNLCRCTGYRPIRDAAIAACSNRQSVPPTPDLAEKEHTSLFIGDNTQFFSSPASADDLATLLEKHPDATIVAGATDVGLWITKHLKTLPKIIYLGNVPELNFIKDTNDRLTIGANISYDAGKLALAKIHPDIAQIIRRLGSRQVRSSGTIIGNIANGSPIGDTPPLFIALDASLTLKSKFGHRTIALEDFFIDYGEQDLQAGEYVHEVSIPKLEPNQVFRAGKISKRYDQDISALLGAMRLTLEGTKILEARIAFGGMAGTPKRAPQTELLLKGRDVSTNLYTHLKSDLNTALKDDYSPMSDMRASASYRQQAALGLIIRFLIELQGNNAEQTRIFENPKQEEANVS